MGVGLYLNGRYQPSATDDPAGDFLDSIANWCDEDIAGDDLWGNFLIDHRRGETHDGNPALFVSIHPAGEDVEFIVPEPGRIIVSTKTSTVGPGYHTALCQLLHRFGEERQVLWNPAGEDDHASQDETGYFFTGDRAAVEAEMLLHLKTIARVSIDTLQTLGHTLHAWHLPIDHNFSEYPGGLHTPLGVRSNEWVRAVAEDPSNGRDLYPWWDDGLTASAYLGLALCNLWAVVRWRPTLTDAEYDAWDFVCSNLCKAYELDPSLDYPWREWAELIDILDDFEGASDVTPEIEAEVCQRAAFVPATQPLIGYRRYPVRVRLLDGWSIQIPGEMTERLEDDSWAAWDETRTVWFRNWGLARQDGSAVPAREALDAMPLPEGEVIPYQNGAMVGKATVRETLDDEDQKMLNFQAFSAVDGKVALCNVFYHDPADRDWAVAVWHSLNATA